LGFPRISLSVSHVFFGFPTFSFNLFLKYNFFAPLRILEYNCKYVYFIFKKFLHSHNEDCTHSNNWRTVKHTDTSDIGFFRAFVMFF
jgi:hypothetical protein